MVRSPAYRGEGGREVSFEMQLPPVIAVKPVLVRVPRPWGGDAGVVLHHGVVDEGPPDPRVALVDGLGPPASPPSRAWLAIAAIVLVALLAALRLLG